MPWVSTAPCHRPSTGKIASPGFRATAPVSRRNLSAALGPLAVDALVIRGNLAFEPRAHRGELQFQVEIGKRNRARFDGEHALFQAIQRRAKRAIRPPGEMQQQMKLGLAGAY